MSDLTRFRDYCRKQADRPMTSGPSLPDRELFTRLANEIDAWLREGFDTEVETAPLWEDS